jgi:hypothetical protein
MPLIKQGDSRMTTPTESSTAVTQRCVQCKTRRPLSVHQFANGNTGWRCVVCEQIVCLIPGTYLDDEARAWLVTKNPPYAAEDS